MRPSALRIAVALAALTGPAGAQPLSAGTAESSCGGDAYSSAEVVENNRPRRGPLVAVPQTLCADVAPQPGSATTQIDVYPIITPEIGPGGGRIPYGGGSPRPYRP